MQQRVELSSRQNQPMIMDGCSDLTLAITDEATYAHLMLPPSVARIQITGKKSLNGLALSASGQVVRIFASDPRSIRKLQIECLVLEVANLSVDRLHLFDSTCDRPPPGICFIDVSEPLALSQVSASGQIVVRRQGREKSIGVFADRDSNAQNVSTVQAESDFYAEIAYMSVEELHVPSLVVAMGVCLTLKGWAYEVEEYPIVLVLAKYAVLRLEGNSSIGPMKVDGPEGSIELVSAIAERIAGILGCLTTSGPCVFRGDNLRLSKLRCSVDADITGLLVHSLDLASLSHAAQASAFDVVLPKDQSWRGFYALTASSAWWREPTAWRTLYQQLERKGRPATAAWARQMEREARRKSASRFSVEYAVLEIGYLLGYGERVVRPLFVQACVALLGWLLIVIYKAYPVGYKARDIALLPLRLYLAPLSVLRIAAFSPDIGTSIVAYLVWAAVALSGVVCFGTAALAVRRVLAYS